MPSRNVHILIHRTGAAKMLLRTSISNTKKFFQKTLDSVKSFLSGGYQRLPKSPPCNSFPCGGGMDFKCSKRYRELDKVYATNQWDSDEEKAKSASKKKDASTAEERVSDNLIKHAKASPAKSYQLLTQAEDHSKRGKIVYKGKRYQDSSVSKGVREERGFLVAKKLKELEMLDKTNVEHVLDIEEILHYYSRLTCPAYLDIVDSFFMDMYSELLSGQASSRATQSWPQLQTVRF